MFDVKDKRAKIYFDFQSYFGKKKRKENEGGVESDNFPNIIIQEVFQIDLI